MFAGNAWLAVHTTVWKYEAEPLITWNAPACSTLEIWLKI